MICSQCRGTHVVRRSRPMGLRTDTFEVYEEACSCKSGMAMRSKVVPLKKGRAKLAMDRAIKAFEKAMRRTAWPKN